MRHGTPINNSITTTIYFPIPIQLASTRTFLPFLEDKCLLHCLLLILRGSKTKYRISILNPTKVNLPSPCLQYNNPSSPGQIDNNDRWFGIRLCSSPPGVYTSENLMWPFYPDHLHFGVVIRSHFPEEHPVIYGNPGLVVAVARSKLVCLYRLCECPSTNRFLL